ncbi:hypothetical protein [Roseicitreum antarcticum]|uniref:hypothetical protein n=1 Tax=Roseicitreum antarcticum TaxID=564137 RepID=UPI000B896B6B|nr:hypothetical protein [Roseicitreum antarcticum]
MKNYIAAGFDPARFWEITPSLMSIEMDGAAERQKRERAMVWCSAMLPHLKKPPKFEQFVNPKAKPKRQSPQQQQAMLGALAAAWGARVVK